jgi:transcriptional regulator GlxA family with amidase domain
VFPLARSGVLEGHKCSVHWCYAASFATEFPEIEAVDDVIMVDRKRFTASGAAAAFDLMLQLIEVRLGESVATEVACWFQHPLVRGQGVRQKVPTIKSGSTADMLPRPVAAAITLFAENIDVPISVQEVAQEVGVSPRQLERGFKSATGQSPLQYYRSMRMNAARQMVMYSKDTMTEIAHAVGYASGSQLAAYYREVFGLSPQEDRRKINMFRVEENQSLPST